MEKKQLKKIIEAVLLSSGRPLAVRDLVRIASSDEDKVKEKQVEAVLVKLVDECEERGIELKKVASGYRYQTREAVSPWITKLWEEKPPRYSRALLETLALIAYRQPITRAEIEDVRGVTVSSRIVRLLEDRDWIKVVGRKETPGRPALYATTQSFLDYFGLSSLSELPSLMEAEKVAQLHPELALPLTGQDTDAAAAADNFNGGRPPHSETAEDSDHA